LFFRFHIPDVYFPFVFAALCSSCVQELLLRRPKKMAASASHSEGLRKFLSAKGSRQGKENCRESRRRERAAIYLCEVMNTHGRDKKHIFKPTFASIEHVFMPAFSYAKACQTLPFCQGQMTSCHFWGNGTFVARNRVRAKELSKVISNNIV